MKRPRLHQVSRRSLQLFVLLLTVLTPVLARYTNYLSSRELDKVSTRFESSVQGVALRTTDAALALVTGVERPMGERRKAEVDELLVAARSARGSTWSFELFGVTLTDPLAALESAAASRSLRWVLLAGALIPLLGTLLLGRVFCSWICPAGFLFELSGKLRKVLRVLELKPGNVRLWHGNKFVILAVGLAVSFVVGLPLLGYLYPPALVGREAHNGITVLFDRAEEGALGFSAAGLTLASWCLLGIADGRGRPSAHACGAARSAQEARVYSAARPTSAILRTSSGSRRELHEVRSGASWCATWGCQPDDRSAWVQECDNCGVCVSRLPRRRPVVPGLAARPQERKEVIRCEGVCRWIRRVLVPVAVGGLVGVLAGLPATRPPHPGHPALRLRRVLSRRPPSSPTRSWRGNVPGQGDGLPGQAGTPRAGRRCNAYVHARRPTTSADLRRSDRRPPRARRAPRAPSVDLGAEPTPASRTTLHKLVADSTATEGNYRIRLEMELEGAALRDRLPDRRRRAHESDPATVLLVWAGGVDGPACRRAGARRQDQAGAAPGRAPGLIRALDIGQGGRRVAEGSWWRCFDSSSRTSCSRRSILIVVAQTAYRGAARRGRLGCGGRRRSCAASRRRLPAEVGPRDVVCNMDVGGRTSPPCYRGDALPTSAWRRCREALPGGARDLRAGELPRLPRRTTTSCVAVEDGRSRAHLGGHVPTASAPTVHRDGPSPRTPPGYFLHTMWGIPLLALRGLGGADPPGQLRAVRGRRARVGQEGRGARPGRGSTLFRHARLSPRSCGAPSAARCTLCQVLVRRRCSRIDRAARGSTGNQLASHNVAPLLTWTVWWGGLVVVILFAGEGVVLRLPVGCDRELGRAPGVLAQAQGARTRSPVAASILRNVWLGDAACSSG